MSKLILPRNLSKTGVRMQAEGTHVDLYLFGVIGDWWDGNEVGDVLAQLQSARDAETITVYLSSVGGYFEDGLPIFNLLRQHPANVTVHIMGYALSMASHIMLAADKIRMAQNAQIMIHNAQAVAYGDYRNMESAAKQLKSHNASLIPEYQRRMGNSAEAVQALLDAETWYTADEALAAGLVDEIIDPIDAEQLDSAQPDNAWRFAAENFKHPPQTFQTRLESALHRGQATWVQNILKRVVGEPPAAINLPETETEDTDVTPEELQAAVEAAIKPLNQKIDELEQKIGNAQPQQQQPQAEETPEPEQEADEKDKKIAALEAQLAKANGKVTELETEQPEKNPKAPVNTGPAGETKYDY